MGVRDLGNPLGNPLALPRRAAAVPSSDGPYDGDEFLFPRGANRPVLEPANNLGYLSGLVKSQNFQPAELPNAQYLPSADGSLVVAFWTNSIHLYAKKGKSLDFLSTLSPGVGSFSRVCASPTLEHIAIASGANVYVFRLQGNMEYAPLTMPSLPSGTKYAMAFSPDGKRLAIANSLSAYTIMLIVDGDSVVDVSGQVPNGTIQGRALCFSPDGRFLYTSSNKAVFTVPSDPESAPVEFSAVDETPVAIQDCAFSPDGRHLVAHPNHLFILNGQESAFIPAPDGTFPSSPLSAGLNSWLFFTRDGEYLFHSVASNPSSPNPHIFARRRVGDAYVASPGVVEGDFQAVVTSSFPTGVFLP